MASAFPAWRLSAAEVRVNREARALNGPLRDAYHRMQTGAGTDADWESFLPAREIARRASLRAAHPLGELLDLDRIPRLTAQPRGDVETCTEIVCGALASAGLGGMRADGDVECLTNPAQPSGYDAITNEIWMDVRWFTALQEYAADPSRHAVKAITVHALVHEHLHVNSPINADLRDAGFLDPAQVVVEEACVDALARRVTARLLGRIVDGQAYRPLASTMQWLDERTGRNATFAIWSASTLHLRIRAANRTIVQALGLLDRREDEPAWVDRFRGFVLEREAELYLLLDASELLASVAREVDARRPRPGFAARFLDRDRADLRQRVDGALASARAARERAIRRRT